MLSAISIESVYVPLDLKVGIQRLVLSVRDCEPTAIPFDDSTRRRLAGLLGTSKAVTIHLDGLHAGLERHKDNTDYRY